MRVVALLGLVTAIVRAQSPPLTISLETNWPAPPILLEILYIPPCPFHIKLSITPRETAYDEEPSSYFSLLDLFATHLTAGNLTSSQSILTTSLDLITTNNLLPKASSLSTFRLALALHATVPRIEALYSYYESTVDEDLLGVRGCESWVEWKGKGFCGVDELKRDIEQSIQNGGYHE